MNRNTAQRGFTLVELMLSLGIIILLAAIAAPMFGSNDSMQLSIAKRLLVSDLEYAQILAIANPDEEIALCIDPSGKGWCITTIDAPTTPLTDAITGEPLLTILGEGAGAPSGDVVVQSNTAGNMVAFDPNGGLVDFSQAVQLLLQSGELETSVDINPTTGSIR